MIKIVKNEPIYYEFIRKLRTDPRVKDGFIAQNDITPEQQKQYMEKYGAYFLIALYEDYPVGFVRSIDSDISICVDPEYQHKGIGKLLIEEIMKLYPESFAKIKVSNEKSKQLFKSCGFIETYVIMEPKK